MSFLSPLAFFLAVLGPVLALLYLLKVRRQDHVVASTLLWRQLTRDVTAHEPWQRLRWNPLLLLQLLVLLLLIFALARPALTLRAAAARYEVLVLATGASTQAVDVQPNRFAMMKRTAQHLLATLPTGSQTTLIAAGATPVTLISNSSNPAAVQRALAHVQAGLSGVNMQEALVLAISLAEGHANARIDVVTDGVFSPLTEVPHTSVPIHFIRIAGSGNNEGITALSARVQPTSPTFLSVFVRVANDGRTAFPNTLELLADGKLLESRTVSAEPGASQDFVFNRVPRTVQVVTAKLMRPDALAADNQASLVLEQEMPPRVLLVTTGNRFLLTALHFLPITLFEATPSQLSQIDVNLYDLVVFDSYVPAILPQGNLLLINPPNSPLLQVTGTERVTTMPTVSGGAPLMSNVDLQGFRALQVERVTTPEWAQPVAMIGSTPLVLQGKTQGHLIVALTFPLEQSNLPLLPAFPILLANAVRELVPRPNPTLMTAANAAQLIVDPLPQATSVEITFPDGKVRRYPLKPGREFTLPTLAEAGIYTVVQYSATGILQRRLFAANVLDPQETAIEQDAIPMLHSGSGSRVIHSAASVHVTQREWWPLLATGAMLLLIGEWWWYHRRA